MNWKGGRLVAKTVRKVSFAGDEGLVFNLQVGEPNTFVAEGIVVHNKGGGCFPAGTPIQTTRGQIPIERLSLKDSVLALDPEGRIVSARVEKIFDTHSLILTVETDRGSLRTTSDHPVGLPGGDFLPAGQLRPGQKVLVWKGYYPTATVVRVPGGAGATGLQPQRRKAQYLLAADFVTHNKGGSSSSSPVQSAVAEVVEISGRISHHRWRDVCILCLIYVWNERRKE